MTGGEGRNKTCVFAWRSALPETTPGAAAPSCGAWIGPLLHITVVLLGILMVAATAGEARAEHKIALVIGNNLYAHLDPERQLQKAVNDANAVGNALERDGFTVLRGSNLSRAQIVDKLFEISARIQPGDTALFYFAGHGVALGSGNYLIPSDVPDIEEGQEMRLASQSVSEGDIIATLQDKGARVSVIILDACRDNPFKKPGLRSVGMERGFGRMPEANGVFSLYSAGYGQSALDRLSNEDKNPNSVFTRVLVPLLTKPGLNLDDLAYDVREQVAELAATTPDHHAQTPAAYNQIIGGRVYLSGTEPPVIPPPPKPAPPAVVVAAPPPTQPPAPPPAQVAIAVPPSSSAPPPSAPDDASVALALQAELNRLGCDAGPATGLWNAKTRSALLRLTRAKNLAADVDRPDRGTLDRLRDMTAPACQSGPDRAAHIESRPVARVRRVTSRATQQRVERRVAQRSVAARAAPRSVSRAGSCFEFNGQRVCE